MGLGTKREKLSDSKQSHKEQIVIRKYIDWYEKAKGRKPEVIRLTGDQFKKLGVSEGFIYDGARLLRTNTDA